MLLRKSALFSSCIRKCCAECRFRFFPLSRGFAHIAFEIPGKSEFIGELHYSGDLLEGTVLFYKSYATAGDNAVDQLFGCDSGIGGKMPCESFAGKVFYFGKI